MVREKSRYLLVEIICKDNLKWKAGQLQMNQSDVYAALMHAVQKVHGIIGFAYCFYTMKVKLLNKQTRIVYIRVSRSDHRALITSIPFVESIGRRKCTLRTLHIGGSIRSCHKVLRQYHREQLNVLLSSCTTEEEKKEVHLAIEEGLAYVKRQSKIGNWEKPMDMKTASVAPSTHVQK